MVYKIDQAWQNQNAFNSINPRLKFYFDRFSDKNPSSEVLRTSSHFNDVVREGGTDPNAPRITGTTDTAAAHVAVDLQYWSL